MVAPADLKILIPCIPENHVTWKDHKGKHKEKLYFDKLSSAMFSLSLKVTSFSLVPKLYSLDLSSGILGYTVGISGFLRGLTMVFMIHMCKHGR